MAEGTKQYRQGKFLVTTYPDIYWHFVRELKLHHEDIDELLNFQKLRLDDGTAITALNQLLGTTVLSSMPMELGFELLLEGLHKRRRDQAVERHMAGEIAAMEGYKTGLRDQHGVEFQVGDGISEKGIWYDAKNPEDIGAQPKK